MWPVAVVRLEQALREHAPGRRRGATASSGRNLSAARSGTRGPENTAPPVVPPPAPSPHPVAVEGDDEVVKRKPRPTAANVSASCPSRAAGGAEAVARAAAQAAVAGTTMREAF
jgi:hypothetical protein